LLLMSVAVASLVAAALIGSGPASPAGERCDAAGTRELVDTFISAFNRGDMLQLDAVFARGMWWKWFAVGNTPGKRVQRAAYNRGSLMAYFRARHKKHERLQLRLFRSSVEGMEGYVNFTYKLVRRADDLRTPRLYVGKGAMSCWTGNLALWNMGEDKN
jgi:hypothetical protein